MSDSSEELMYQETTSSQIHQGPVVGIVATGDNGDDVASAILQADGYGCLVLLTYPLGKRPPIIDAIDSPHVRIVPPSEDEKSSDEDRKRRLQLAAQTHTEDPLIYAGEAVSSVDYERTLETWNSQSSCDDRRIIDISAQTETLVAIPAYNEAGTIASVVKAAQSHADDVVVIDDGSSDETATEAEGAGASVVEHEYNQGYGAALQTAFEAASDRNAECLVIIDGDGQHDTNDIPTVANRVIDGDANVAIASRFGGEEKSSIPLYRRFGLSVVNLLTNISMGSFLPRNWIQDTQSGFRAYDRQSVENLAETDAIGTDMDASLDVLYQLAETDSTFEEVGTTIDYDVENASSQHPVRHGLTLVSTILRTVEQDHPVLSLGVPGFMITLGGLTAGYLTMANYIETNTFPLGLALISSFLVLLGVFAGFTAIILHSLQAHLNS